MYVLACTYVLLQIDYRYVCVCVYIYIYIYVCVYPCWGLDVFAWLSVSMCLLCVCFMTYFVWGLLIHFSQSKWKWSDKAEKTTT